MIFVDLCEPVLYLKLRNIQRQNHYRSKRIILGRFLLKTAKYRKSSLAEANFFDFRYLENLFGSQLCLFAPVQFRFCLGFINSINSQSSL